MEESSSTHIQNKTSLAMVVSDDPLDFASFIVYLQKKRKPNETTELRALRELCQSHSEIVTRFVDEIATEDRPPWLKGVPTVVTLPSYSITMGSPAINKVIEWCSKRPSGTEAMSQSGGSVFSSPLEMSGDLIPAEEREKETVVSSCSSIEELLRRRESFGEGPLRGRVL